MAPSDFMQINPVPGDPDATGLETTLGTTALQLTSFSLTYRHPSKLRHRDSVNSFTTELHSATWVDVP